MKTRKGYNVLMIITLILCICGLVLLVLSIMDYNKNWTLPTSLGIITLANFMNLYNIRKQIKKNNGIQSK
mgnify:CR=1 FL=1